MKTGKFGVLSFFVLLITGLSFVVESEDVSAENLVCSNPSELKDGNLKLDLPSKVIPQDINTAYSEKCGSDRLTGTLADKCKDGKCRCVTTVFQNTGDKDNYDYLHGVSFVLDQNGNYLGSADLSLNIPPHSSSKRPAFSPSDAVIRTLTSLRQKNPLSDTYFEYSKTYQKVVDIFRESFKSTASSYPGFIKDTEKKKDGCMHGSGLARAGAFGDGTHRTIEPFNESRYGGENVIEMLGFTGKSYLKSDNKIKIEGRKVKCSEIYERFRGDVYAQFATKLKDASATDNLLKDCADSTSPADCLKKIFDKGVRKQKAILSGRDSPTNDRKYSLSLYGYKNSCKDFDRYKSEAGEEGWAPGKQIYVSVSEQVADAIASSAVDKFLDTSAKFTLSARTADFKPTDPIKNAIAADSKCNYDYQVTALAVSNVFSLAMNAIGCEKPKGAKAAVKPADDPNNNKIDSGATKTE